MRYKIVFERLILIAIAVYVIHLGVNSNLNLYIHPRYIIFTFALSVIALGMLTLDSVLNTQTRTHKQSSKLSNLPLILMVGFALFLPARTLTSATISQRSTDTGSIVSTTQSEPINTLFAGSSKGLKLGDWSRLLASNEDPAFYVNKPAKISGFVYNAGLGQDTLWLARFVLTCCAVDAQPIGVPVQIDDWQQEFSEDEWVEVQGSFELLGTDLGDQLVLLPETIKSIEQPDNPYGN